MTVQYLNKLQNLPHRADSSSGWRSVMEKRDDLAETHVAPARQLQGEGRTGPTR